MNPQSPTTQSAATQSLTTQSTATQSIKQLSMNRLLRQRRWRNAGVGVLLAGTAGVLLWTIYAGMTATAPVLSVRSGSSDSVSAAPAFASVNNGANADVAPTPATISLATHCPPGFELTPANRCEFRSLYQQYSSLTDRGVGGLKTALPAVRDGFSPQQIDLGRYLFFDPLLSADGTVSCASCHQPDRGFSDGRPHSIGIKQQAVTRSAPSLWNVAFLQRFFWDGRGHSLEEQMQGPLYAGHEMGNSREALLKSLNANTHYRRLFREAFAEPDSAGGEIRLDQVYGALAAFESSLISLNSRYDQYAHGFHDALNAQEIAGLNVFRSFVARCAECHTPPLFTNQQIAVIGTPEPDGLPFDGGAGSVSGVASQRGGFKVPSLRNVALTAPYMHSGRFGSLHDVAEFYTKGRGHAVPADEKLVLHWHIWEPKLSAAELDQIVAFLGTLTDESFVPRVPSVLPSGLSPALPVGQAVAGSTAEKKSDEIPSTKAQILTAKIAEQSLPDAAALAVNTAARFSANPEATPAAKPEASPVANLAANGAQQ